MQWDKIDSPLVRTGLLIFLLNLEITNQIFSSHTFGSINSNINSPTHLLWKQDKGDGQIKTFNKGTVDNETITALACRMIASKL